MNLSQSHDNVYIHRERLWMVCAEALWHVSGDE